MKHALSHLLKTIPVLALLLVLWQPLVTTGYAQDKSEDSPAIEGTWEGKIITSMGGSLRVVLHLKQVADGLSATMDSPDQNATGIPVERAFMVGDSLFLDVPATGDGKYAGRFNPEQKEIDGTWSQNGGQVALKFSPATTENNTSTDSR